LPLSLSRALRVGSSIASNIVSGDDDYVETIDSLAAATEDTNGNTAKTSDPAL
jgi:hypothetical protein